MLMGFGFAIFGFLECPKGPYQLSFKTKIARYLVMLYAVYFLCDI